MARRPRAPSGLPSREQIVEFIQSSERPAGKREIAKAFGLLGEEKIALKRLLKDMAEEGLIDGQKTAFHRMGGVPKVTVLRVVDVEDGEAIAIPDAWHPDDGAPPRGCGWSRASAARRCASAIACLRAPRRRGADGPRTR